MTREAVAEREKMARDWLRSDAWCDATGEKAEVAEVSKLLEKWGAVCANEARLEEAERMYANWNVDESIRRFDVWAKNHIAELRALKAEGLK